jgi:hypothetical protein
MTDLDAAIRIVEARRYMHQRVRARKIDECDAALAVLRGPDDERRTRTARNILTAFEEA